MEHLRRQPFEGYFWVGPEICTNLYESINHTHTCVSSESTTTLELMIIGLCGTKAVITYLSPFLAFNDPTIIRLFPIYPTIDPKSGPNDALILVQIISWSFSFASTQFDHFFYNRRSMPTNSFVSNLEKLQKILSKLCPWHNSSESNASQQEMEKLHTKLVQVINISPFWVTTSKYSIKKVPLCRQNIIPRWYWQHFKGWSLLQRAAFSKVGLG